MNWNTLLLRLRALFLRRRMDGELGEEIAAHLELQTQKHIRAGMNADEARRRARVEFGAPENAKEECRDERRITWLSHLAQDLRYAIRTFRRAPAFTGLIIFILALGMGVNLATFSVIDAVLLRMLPVRDPASLFRTVRASGNADDSSGDGSSYLLYRKMQKRSGRFADLIAYRAADPAVISIGRSEPERVMQQTVSGNYFRVLGVQPVEGQLISPEDDGAPGQHAVAVISYRLWRRMFNKSERAIGSKLQFENHAFDIIGVAPAAFFGVEVGKMVDVWTPVSMAPADNLSNDHNFWLHIMGRLKPGVTIPQAASPMQAVMNEAMLEDVRQHAPPGTPKQVIDRFLAGMRIKGVPAGGGISYLRNQYQKPFQIMMFVVALVLLIACSNVASLLIAKGSTRRQEIAIRLSLGAGKGRILQQLMTEGLLLALISAGAGLFLAHWGIPLLVRLLTPSTAPAQLATGIDLRLLAFTSCLSFFTVLVCGLLPGLRLAGTNTQMALKNGPRLTDSGSGRLRKVLVASQVALSFMLIIGAVLLASTLVNLMASYLGFNPSDVLVTRIALQHPGTQNFLPAWTELLRRVQALSGVEQASLTSAGLFTGEPPLMGIRTTAAKALPTDPITGQLFVSTGYFQTLGIAFVSGQDFGLRDNNPGSPPRAIVNQAFVRKFFGNENPLGRRLTKLANAPLWTEIVGVVKDTKYSSLRESPPPMIYIPYGRMKDWIAPQAHPGVSMFLQVRGRQSAASLAADLRREIGQQFTIGDIARQQQLINDTLVRERLLASVASLFGGLALLLAALGLYGIMSYAVVQRRQELGIRMAIGATPKTILSLMLRDSAIIVGLGLAAGVLAAASTTHFARALLFGLTPDDPATFVAASLVLLIVAMTAAFIPAYKASKTDPMVTLRHD